MSKSNIEIIFSAIDQNVKKVLDQLQKASTRTSQALTGMVDQTKKHIHVSGRHIPLVQNTAKAIEGLNKELDDAKGLHGVLTKTYQTLANENVAVQRVFEGLTGTLVLGNKELEKYNDQGEDATKTLKQTKFAMGEVQKRTMQFTSGLADLQLTFQQLNTKNLPDWINNLDTDKAATQATALQKHYLAGNIEVVGNKLRFANAEVMKSIGFTAEHRKALERQNKEYIDYYKLVDGAKGQTKGYRTAIGALGQTFGKTGKDVAYWGGALEQSTKALTNIRQQSQMAGTTLQKVAANQIGLANTAFGVLQKNIAVTGGQYKVLNQEGLKTIGISETQARELGILSNSYSMYDSELAKVSKRSRENINVYKALASRYSENTTALKDIARVTNQADLVSGHYAASLRDQARLVGETTEKGKGYLNLARLAESEQTKLSVATGLLNGELKYQNGELINVTKNFTNHKKVVQEVTGIYGKGSPKIQQFETGIQRLGIGLNDTTKHADLMRRDFLRTFQVVENYKNQFPELARNLDAVNVQQAINANQLVRTSKAFKIKNEAQLRAVGLSEQEAAAMGVLSKNYSFMESSVNRVSKANKTHSDVLREVGRGYENSRKHMTALNAAYDKTQAQITTQIQEQERLRESLRSNGQEYSHVDKEIARLNSRSHMSERLTKNFSNELNRAGIAAGVYGQHVEQLASKLKLTDQLKETYVQGLKKVGITSKSSALQVEHLGKKFDVAYSALLQTGVQSRLTEKQLVSLMGNTKNLSSIVDGLGISYRKTHKGLEVFDTASRRWTQTQIEMDKAGNVQIRAVKNLGSEYDSIGKQIGQVHGGLNRLYAALRVTASYMIAGTAMYGLMATFIGAKKAIFEFDQALKNLQAITMATAGQVSVMDRVMKQVASSTKFSATEIGDAMIYIGQSGFSAAESVQTIQAVADLATGTLASLTETSNLLTTTLRVFELQAHESARVADVFANAINKSKTTVDKLNVTMNYLGPIAHSAGMSIEETAVAIMALSNAGIRASTVGTGFRQMISRLLAPTASLTDMIERAGLSIEDFNIEIQNAKTNGNGFATVIKNLSGVLQGDPNKAFKAFGLRGASVAIVLSRLGEHVEFFIDQVSEVGTAARMAEIQMGGLQVSAKNLMDKMGLLAITIGEVLRPAIHAVIDGLRHLADAFTAFFGNQVTQYTLAIVSMTAAIMGLYQATRLLVAVTFAKFLGTTVKGLMEGRTATLMLKMAYEKLTAITLFYYTVEKRAAVATLASAAAKGRLSTVIYTSLLPALNVLKTAFLSLWAVVSTHYILALIAAISALVVIYKKLKSGQIEAMKALEANAISAKEASEDYARFSKQLKEVEKGSREHRTTMDRLTQKYPELTFKLREFGDDVEKTTKFLDDYSESQREISHTGFEEHLLNVVKLAKENAQEMARNAEIIRTNASAWTVLKQHFITVNKELGWTPVVAQRAITALRTFVDLTFKGKEVLLKDARMAFAAGSKAATEFAKTLALQAHNLDDTSAKTTGAARDTEHFQEVLKMLAEQFPELMDKFKGFHGFLEKMRELSKEGGVDFSDFAKGFAYLIEGLPDEAKLKWVKLFDSASASGQEFMVRQAQSIQKYREELEKLKGDRVLSVDAINALVLKKEKELYDASLRELSKHVIETAKKLYSPYEIQQEFSKRQYQETLNNYKKELSALDEHSDDYVRLMKQMYDKMQRETDDYYKEQVKNLDKSYNTQVMMYQELSDDYKDLVAMSMLETDKQYREERKRLLIEEYDQRKSMYDELTGLIGANKQEELKIIRDASEDIRKVREELSKELIKIDEETNKKIEDLQKEHADRVKDILSEQTDKEFGLLGDEEKILQARINIYKEYETFRKAVEDKNLEGAERALKNIEKYEEHSVARRAKIQADGSIDYVKDEEETVRVQKRIADQRIEMEKDLLRIRQESVQKEQEELKAKAKKEADVQIGEIKRIESEQIASLRRQSAAFKTMVEEIRADMNELNEAIAEIKRIEIKVSMAELNEEMKKVVDFIKNFDETANVVFMFWGKGSSVKPLTEKIDEIGKKIKDFKGDVDDLDEKSVLVEFQGSEKGGEKGSLSEVVKDLKEKTDDLSKSLDEFKDQNVNLEFTGQTGEGKTGLTEATSVVMQRLRGVQEAAKALSQTINTDIKIDTKSGDLEDKLFKQLDSEQQQYLSIKKEQFEAEQRMLVEKTQKEIEKYKEGHAARLEIETNLNRTLLAQSEQFKNEITQDILALTSANAQASKSRVDVLRTELLSSQLLLSRLEDNLADLDTNGMVALSNIRAKVRELNEELSILEERDTAVAFRKGIEKAAEEVQTLGELMFSLGYQINDKIADNFSDMFSDIISGTRGATRSVEEFARETIKWVSQVIIKWYMLKKLFNAMGMQTPEADVAGDTSKFSLKTNSFPLLEGKEGYADGGKVPGFSPHAKADNINAKLTAGEYVMPVDSVKHFGEQFMNDIKNKQLPRFAVGGPVVPKNTSSSPSKPSGMNLVVNVTNTVPDAEVTTSQPRFDGVQWVADMFVQATDRNVNGIRNMMRTRR